MSLIVFKNNMFYADAMTLCKGTIYNSEKLMHVNGVSLAIVGDLPSPRRFEQMCVAFREAFDAYNADVSLDAPALMIEMSPKECSFMASDGNSSWMCIDNKRLAHIPKDALVALGSGPGEFKFWYALSEDVQEAYLRTSMVTSTIGTLAMSCDLSTGEVYRHAVL